MICVLFCYKQLHVIPCYFRLSSTHKSVMSHRPAATEEKHRPSYQASLTITVLEKIKLKISYAVILAQYVHFLFGNGDHATASASSRLLDSSLGTINALHGHRKKFTDRRCALLLLLLINDGS
jgi:hypothetical protein